MLIDLEDIDVTTAVEADIVIVGGGIAGLIAANKLNNNKHRVAVIESGGNQEITPDPLYTDLEFENEIFGGAIDGRSRCLGGTSVKWGGALLPFLPQNYLARPQLNQPGWPISENDLRPYLVEAEKIFGLNNGAYDADIPEFDEVWRSNGFIPREAKWPRFSNRNVATLFRKEINAKAGPVVYTNATVREFSIENGQLNSITAFGSRKQRLEVKAKQFIISAGAIESTRLLLLLDQQSDGQLIQGREHLGCYLQDHLSVPLATIETNDTNKLNSLFGFRFERSVMRSVRIERATVDGAAGFIHVAPRSLKRSAFDAVRDFFRSLQARKPDVNALLRAAMDMPYLVQLAFWRLFYKRLLWPSPAEYDVHFVIEQVADKSRVVRLGNRTDALGHPVASLKWKRNESDVEIFRELCTSFSQAWETSRLKEYGELRWPVPPEELQITHIRNASDIYHPVGTTRMAHSAADGVVAENLSVFGLPNLFVASTSVMPNCGGANPTMTLIALTLRLVNTLRKEPMC